MSSSSPEKHDRSYPQPAHALLFRAGELLAPRLGGRVVRNLWFTVPPLAPDTRCRPAGSRSA